MKTSAYKIDPIQNGTAKLTAVLVLLLKIMVLNLKIKSSTSFYDFHIIKLHHSKSVAREIPLQ